MCFTFVFTDPPALSVNVTKNIETLSIVVQWDVVDDFLPTNYTVTWTSESDDIQVTTPIEQTSYILTGLTVNTVYTITVTAANMCGSGPEFTTSISFSSDTTGIKMLPIGDIRNCSSDNSELSTITVAIITTFIVSVTVTAIITFIVTYFCVKRTLDKANTRNHKHQSPGPQEKVLYEQVSSTIQVVTKDDLELQPNPAYGTSQKVTMDTNPAYESCK